MFKQLQFAEAQAHVKSIAENLGYSTCHGKLTAEETIGAFNYSSENGTDYGHETVYLVWKDEKGLHAKYLLRQHDGYLSITSVTIEGDQVVVKYNRSGANEPQVVSTPLSNLGDPSVLEQRMWSEMKRLVKEKESVWKTQPSMPLGTLQWVRKDLQGGNVLPAGTPDRVPYAQPRAGQSMVNEKDGVAAFVVEEQIDHEVGNGRQMRHELYVVTTQAASKRVFEDHAYDKEGQVTIEILTVTDTSVKIKTRQGEKSIALK